MTTQNALNNQTVNANFTTNRTDSGSQALNTVAHSQNTAGSDAVHRAQVAGTSAGDAFVELAAGAARSYALGIDTSTTDQDLKLTTATAASVTPSTGTTLITVQAVSPDTFPRSTSDILITQFQYNAPGNSVQTQVIQQDATNAASHAIDRISTPVGGGDPMTQWVKEGVINHIMGLASTDNSLRIGNGGSPSALATERWRMTVAGERTMPLQPVFFAQLSANDANVTGAGAAYLLGTTGNVLTVNQQGTSMSTLGVFTFPVTGWYELKYNLIIDNLTAAMTNGQVVFYLNGGATQLVSQALNIGAIRTPGNTAVVNGSIFFNAAAAATMQIALQISNGAGNTAQVRGTLGGVAQSWFSGALIC